MKSALDLTLERAVTLHGHGAVAQAAAMYAEILRLEPEHPDALHLLGVAETQSGRPQQGLELIARSLALNPSQPVAAANRGNAFIALGRPHEALDCYDIALALAPDNPLAHNGRGNALAALDRPEEALASYDRALELAPSFPEALVGGGNALMRLERSAAALASFDRALALDPGSGAALYGRGMALYALSRHEEAVVSFLRLREIDPAGERGLCLCLHAQLQVCNWFEYRVLIDAMVGSVERGVGVDSLGGWFLAVSDSPRLQLRWARRLVAEFRPRVPALWAGERYPHERIRVAYVSADFLEHPTSYLMAGLFEKHDRTRFEAIGISLREDEHSPMARRVRAAFERFFTAGAQSVVEIAELIRRLEVDVVVDLMGYTALNRTEIFAYRPAPVQVNYLGFPGTLGSADLDYIIADDFLIPEEYRRDYAEQVVYLPECFQANDYKRGAGEPTPTRPGAGLPPGGFVWSALLSAYKINPPLFDVWARLLRAVPGSVLWLVGGSTEVERNLAREAAVRGVEPQRLIFAERLPYPRHLARLRLADVGLDTLPYNGGASTSDALWAGVPVVTCVGRSFAARMSGSLLHALRMPELVTRTLEEYEATALALARSPERLAAVRARLAAQAAASPLFQTDRFRRHLEAAFTHMVERSRRGEPPASFRIAPHAE